MDAEKERTKRELGRRRLAERTAELLQIVENHKFFGEVIFQLSYQAGIPTTLRSKLERVERLDQI